MTTQNHRSVQRRGVRHRRGTDGMRYLEVPVAFRAHGHDCWGFVVDDGRVFARWTDGDTVHLAWVQTRALASLAGAQ